MAPALEQVFSSPGRVKLLKILLEAEELNVSQLVRKAGLTHTGTLRHLSALEKVGLLIQKRFGRIRIYKINYASPHVAALRRFIREWEEVALQRRSQGY